MKLFSLVAMFGDKHYASQLRGESVDDVVKGYFDNHYPEGRSVVFRGDAPEIDSRHIVLLEPMTPCTNMWLCQAGKDGRYVTVILSETVT